MCRKWYHDRDFSFLYRRGFFMKLSKTLLILCVAFSTYQVSAYTNVDCLKYITPSTPEQRMVNVFCELTKTIDNIANAIKSQTFLQTIKK